MHRMAVVDLRAKNDGEFPNAIPSEQTPNRRSKRPPDSRRAASRSGPLLVELERLHRGRQGAV